MEINRRTFMVVLGATAALTTAKAAAPVGRRTGRPATPPRCIFGALCSMPPVRPRSSAITYLEA